MVWPHPRDVIQYARSSYYYDIVYLLNDLIYMLSERKSAEEKEALTSVADTQSDQDCCGLYTDHSVILFGHFYCHLQSKNGLYFPNFRYLVLICQILMIYFPKYEGKCSFPKSQIKSLHWVHARKYRHCVYLLPSLRIATIVIFTTQFITWGHGKI